MRKGVVRELEMTKILSQLFEAKNRGVFAGDELKQISSG